MEIKRDTAVFASFVNNYWVYYRELEKEFMQTQKYVEFCIDNNSTYSVEFMKLFQAVCSEIDVVGKTAAKAINEQFKPEDRKNNIFKWWFEVQDVLLLTDSPFTKMNPKEQPACFSLIDYKCFLLDKIELNPWQDFRVEKAMDRAGRVNYKLAKGFTIPKWWSDYNKVKHHRIVAIENNEKSSNYPKANFGNVSNAFAALYILEKAFMDMVGTRDDLSCFMDFSDLFVKRKRYTFDEMDNIVNAMQSTYSGQKFGH